jgi:cytochrome c
MKPAKIVFGLSFLFAGSVASSFVHPWGNLRSDANAPLLEGSSVPVDVRQVLETKCADCHSTNTKWPAYTRLAPGSWLVERDVHRAREHLNLSQWQRYNLETQIDLLTRIASEAHSGNMPVKRYLILHPNARLSAHEQQLIYDWAKSERRRVRQQMAKLQEKPS